MSFPGLSPMTNPPDDSFPFDTEPNGDLTPPSLMWPMTKIAERDGVSRQAVHKATHKFVNDGVVTGIERDQKGYITAVNIVEYDRARGTSADPAKMQGSATKKIIEEDAGQQPAGKLPSDYTRAITEKAFYETELKKIELRERMGQLVIVSKFDEAGAIAGKAIVAAIERIRFKHDEFVNAIARDGIRGSQAIFKQYINEVCTAVADAMDLMAKSAPAEDKWIDASAAPDDAGGVTLRETAP